jgi:adenosylhomocysteine nucleosidase
VKPTVVCAAMPEEIAPLRARLVGVRRLPVDAPLAVTGTLAGARVVLLVTGDGMANAQARLQALLERVPAARLVGIGVSGALTSDLGPGDLLVGQRVCDEAGVLTPDEQLLAAAARVGARLATLVTAARIADSPAARAQLCGRFQRWPGPAAVDLESTALARVAIARGLPWTILRAISDTAAESLPALIEQSRDESGAVRRRALLRGLLVQPTALPALVALRWRVGRCAQVLATAATRLVAAPAAGVAA